MLYSTVVNNKWILPKKKIYNVRDVNSVMVDSLFKGNRTFTEKEAVFIVKCSAIFHDTDWSKGVSDLLKKLKIV